MILCMLYQEINVHLQQNRYQFFNRFDRIVKNNGLDIAKQLNVRVARNQQNYMKANPYTQMQTVQNTPAKVSFDRFGSYLSNKSHLALDSTLQSTTRLSQTEQQMFSHDLVREVVQASRQKTVWHDINRISQKTALYAKPIKTIDNEFKFDSIPSSNKMYASECYAKIHQIRKELKSERQQTQEEVTNDHKKSPNVHKKRPQSAASRIDTKNPKISIPGLITYNFNSVKAGKSIGFNKVNHEQKLVENLNQDKKRQFCSMQRRHKILAKTSGSRFTRHIKRQEAIVGDFVNDTNSYLSDILNKEQENLLIYNERAKKLKCIKEYMEQEGTQFQEAMLIVNQIQGGKKIQDKIKKPQEKLSLNDQTVLDGRRLPQQSKPLLVRHFLFIQ